MKEFRCPSRIPMTKGTIKWSFHCESFFGGPGSSVYFTDWKWHSLQNIIHHISNEGMTQTMGQNKNTWNGPPDIKYTSTYKKYKIKIVIAQGAVSLILLYKQLLINITAYYFTWSNLHYKLLQNIPDPQGITDAIPWTELTSVESQLLFNISGFGDLRKQSILVILYHRQFTFSSTFKFI